jgi:hypothetical protein
MKSNKRVLIITHDFYNNCAKVGYMIRMTQLANYFVDESIEVNVLACKKNKTWNGLLKLNPKVNVKFIKSYWNYKSTSSFETNTILNKKSTMNTFPKKVLKSLFQLFLSNYLIDRHQLTNRRYINEAKLMIVNKKINNILVSGPRNSIYLVGVQLKKEFGPKVNIITDYRDGWTVRDAFYRGKPQKTINKFKIIEQKILNYNDYSVFTSDRLKKAYEDEFNVKRSLVIENGFIEYSNSSKKPQLEFQKVIEKARNENRIVIGYFGTGSAEGSRTDKNFSNLLLAFESNPSLANRFCLVSQGNVTYPENTPNALMIKNLVGTSNEEARSNMRLIDVLLFVYSRINDAPMIMGGKVYDYIATGKPIWLLVPNNAFSLKAFVARTGKPILTDINESESIVKSLKDIIRLHEKGELAKKGFSYEEASLYTRVNQYKKFLDILM